MAQGDAQKLSPVAMLVAERTGSSLSVQQVTRIQEFVRPRIQGRSEESYVAYLQTLDGAAELAELMSVISVHKTDLFRDDVQLEAFESKVLAPLVGAAKRPLHVWSAGCATGEEVATLLILLEEAGAHPRSTVLGTDISEEALAKARGFTYHPYLFRRVPERLQTKYFTPSAAGHVLSPELRERARFSRHNLMDLPYPQAPGSAGFDVIFCRNVLIYFTAEAFDRVVRALAHQLAPGGTLVLSSAEPILRTPSELTTLKCDQAFFYLRTPPGGAAALRRSTPARGILLPPPTPAVGTVFPPSSRPGAAGAPSPPAPASPGAAPAPSKRTPAVGMVFPKRTPADGTVMPAPRRAPAPAPAEDDPLAEATQLFETVMEWASSGTNEAQTEQGLRQCLYLDPHFAQARYLLGMILEQRGDRATAASEYRRALAALREGRSRQAAFFLNDERMQTACVGALKRLGSP